MITKESLYEAIQQEVRTGRAELFYDDEGDLAIRGVPLRDRLQRVRLLRAARVELLGREKQF